MKNNHPLLKFVLVVITVTSVQSCSNPFRVNPVTNPSTYASALREAKKDDRYVILHSGVDVYRVKFIEIHKSKKQAIVLLDRVDSMQMIQFRNRETTLANPASENLPALSQIHLYTKDSTSYTLDEPHTIPFTNLARIERVK